MTCSISRRLPAKGFTLIELLTVIVIIGILATLISSAIIKAKHRATRVKDKMGAVTLESALRAYRFEYQKWPCDEAYMSAASRPDDVTYRDDNHLVVHGCLMNSQSTRNFKGIRYLSEADYKFDSQSNIVNYMGVPFEIFIDFANDNCDVKYQDRDGNWKSGD